MKVAIVGAGIMGTSAARFLAKRKHEVVVFEAYDLRHRQGSSHGRSRIVRKAYSAPFYAEIMQTGYPMWAELQEEAGVKLLHECGLIYFGSSDSEAMQTQIAGLRALSVEYELVEGADAGRFLEGVTLGPNEVGVYTPEAGWVNADLAVQASWNVAAAHGAAMRQERVEAIPKEFDQVVICAGPWIKKFVPLEARVTLQTVAYVRGNRSGPVWIEDGGRNHYGFPSEPNSDAFKVGDHLPTLEFDPDLPERAASPGSIDLIRSFCSRRFGISDPEIVETVACLYTNTADEDFRIGRLDQRTIYASPCSGHGFKFGPWVGQFLADIVEGKRDTSEYPRFEK